MDRTDRGRPSPAFAVLTALAALLAAAALGACSKGAAGAAVSEGAAGAPSGPGADARSAAGGASAPAEPVSVPVRDGEAVFEYRYTSVRIEDPDALRYRAVFRFHPDGTIRTAELRESRAGSERLLASVRAEPREDGYEVSCRSFGEGGGGYDYTLDWSEGGLMVAAGGEATGFRYDPALRTFEIPWDRGRETYTADAGGGVRAERVLSGKTEWTARLFREGGTLRFEDHFPDGEVDREMILEPSGPDAWRVSCVGAADSLYDGLLVGASLFPGGGTLPASVYNLVIVTDLWMTDERFPFFCLSLLE